MEMRFYMHLTSAIVELDIHCDGCAEGVVEKLASSLQQGDGSQVFIMIL
jgi:hypothetical protein